MTFALACGSLGDASHREPLAVVDGKLTQEATVVNPASASKIRVAVVWASMDRSSTFKTAQDVAVTPVFPSSFRLELTDPPPQEAMSDGSSKEQAPDPTVDHPNPIGGRTVAGLHPSAGAPGFAIATAAVVAYEDLNGNGKLDIVGAEASAYEDRVVGVNEQLLLVYIEGTAPSTLDMNGTHPVAGYNLFVKCSNTGRDPGDPTPDPTRCDSRWLPISTPYDLPLTAEPRFASVMCEGGLFGPGNSSSEDAPSDKSGKVLPPGPGPSGVWPKKDDPKLHCYQDNKGYYYSTCATYPKGLCKGSTTECHATEWGYSTPTPPADWPCPAN